MRRAAATLYIVAQLLLLTGCQANLFSSRRDIELIRPVQTVGLDRRGDGVALSVSTGKGPDGAPALVMTADAGSVETAIERLQDFSPEDELFYAHVRYILLGESMTGGGVMPLVDWAARSPSMRLGTPVFLVKNGAAGAVSGAAGEQTDITERLSALEREALARGCRIPNLREAASALLDRGCALCLAVEGVPSEGVVLAGEAAGTTAVIPMGYAVLEPERLAGYLTEEETLGAELILWGVNGARVESAGNVLDILSGRAEIGGIWEDSGILAGLEIRCTLRAGILERRAGGEEAPNALGDALAADAERWLRQAVARSQSLGLDFLDLEKAVRADAPFSLRARTADWDARFSSLPVSVLVRVEIDRSYDLAG